MNKRFFPLQDILVVWLLVSSLQVIASPAQSSPHQTNTHITGVQEKAALTLADIMKFKDIEHTTISKQGDWIAYSAQPDRGDPVGHIKATQKNAAYVIPYGQYPIISNNGQWVAFKQAIPLLEYEKTEEKARDKLKTNAILINTETGTQQSFERVKSFAFSGDSQLFAVHFYPEDEDKQASDSNVTNEDCQTIESQLNPNAEPTSQATEQANTATPSNNENEREGAVSQEQEQPETPLHYFKEDMIGSTLHVIRLSGTVTLENNNTTSPNTHIIEHVQHYTFAEEGGQLAYTVITPEDQANTLAVLSLAQNNKEDSATFNTPITLAQAAFNAYPHLSWNKKGTHLAFLVGNYQAAERYRPHQLMMYKTGAKKATTLKVARNGWFISHNNKLIWSKDGQRLFFGHQPNQARNPEPNSKVATKQDLYNLDKLTAKRSLQVWHGDDPRIKPQQITEYSDDQAHVYLSVYHLKNNRFVPLADKQMPDIDITENNHAVLGHNPLPYYKNMTWEGFFHDLYHVDLKTGKKVLISKKVLADEIAHVSPNGRYVAYYQDQAFHVFDAKNMRKSNFTQSLDVSFANELHDYPSRTPSYGIAGWLAQGDSVLVYDRYDVWQLNVSGRALNLTQNDGRNREVVYRIIDTDNETEVIDVNKPLLLHAYYDKLKHSGFYQLNLRSASLKKLIEAQKTFSYVANADDADVLLFTQEDMHEFPDLWVTSSDFANPNKVTNVNPQIKDFNWGKPELIDWRSNTGKPLQGILIKPANYQAGKKYPVLVYYYRYFTQRMYQFNPMKVNHRPNFPYYTSHDYAVFLPDIKFDVGTPGKSATDSLVPGIQKIINMGVADPDAIGLHGHSWSGYQTAFVITQTDIFKAAVAGAPVTNMTSAYSGIRLKSGLARQFQYEQGQSRIGASLFDKLNLYIENSPVFYADRINTPLLIQFGDIDGAVPWQQGIEMYLAMRRLNKPVIMLQYEGEPHHLKKYPNKVDYTIKMKAFFDHHLKGKPAPQWMIDGAPYQEWDEEPVNKPEEETQPTSSTH
ncbi:alpha/beta hydrolase family protein [Flocculibacter collagenilyticus]|uniref:alpha/beta hydrolase family protein n=1 Tax=Flocculibacter collagenilyticus TaxID=2744479 RepID=UPI0018F69919|nr:prolyl oligopeptidase family serine peptidase [Flocculibacter collagenilyticus]